MKGQLMPIVATAAWSISKSVADRFPSGGTSLSRYATVLKGVEINSTFYRHHRSSTYARWADSVPDDFRFAVKMPKTITHEQRLHNIAPLFSSFLEEISPLDGRLGPLLCQLPPSLPFDANLGNTAFAEMRAGYGGRIAIEVRHKSWATAEAFDMLEHYAVDRVLADPAPVWQKSDFTESPFYVRLHGKPKVYYSSYGEEEIHAFMKLLAADSWCVFDNTASGAAIENALTMITNLG